MNIIDFLITVILSPVGAIFFGIAVAYFFFYRMDRKRKSKGKALNEKFVSIGDLKGKSYNEIIKKVGNPDYTNIYPDSIAMTWVKEGNYSIVLDFNKEYVCKGIISESWS